MKIIKVALGNNTEAFIENSFTDGVNIMLYSYCAKIKQQIENL